MPLAPLAVPLYPDVPFAPGVPPVLRAFGATAETTALLTSDTVFAAGMFGAPMWGIFDQDGLPVALADTVFCVDFRREYRISDYPVEQGAFASFNKVQRPFDARVTLVKGGPVEDRSAFLSAIGTACGSLDLYSVIVPEFTYPSANLTHYDCRRETRSGVSMLTVEIWLTEVRQTTTGQFSQSGTQAPSGADTVSDGTVQAAAPTGAQASAVTTHTRAVRTVANPFANPVPTGSLPGSTGGLAPVSTTPEFNQTAGDLAGAFA